MQNTRQINAWIDSERSDNNGFGNRMGPPKSKMAINLRCFPFLTSHCFIIIDYSFIDQIRNTHSHRSSSPFSKYKRNSIHPRSWLLHNNSWLKPNLHCKSTNQPISFFLLLELVSYAHLTTSSFFFASLSVLLFSLPSIASCQQIRFLPPSHRSRSSFLRTRNIRSCQFTFFGCDQYDVGGDEGE